MRKLYRQIKNQAGEWELILVEVGPREVVPRLQIMGCSKSRPNYKSIIDGEVITTRRQEREHMKRHDVVRPGDFGPNEGREYYERKAKERHEMFTGEHRELRREVRRDVVESLQKVEQGYKPQVQKEGEPL